MALVIAHLTLTGVLATLLVLVIVVQNAARVLRGLRTSTWDGTERRTASNAGWTGADRRQPAFA